MQTVLLDGKKISKDMQEVIRKQVQDLVASGKKPGIAVLVIGDDPASASYIRAKERAAERLGFENIMVRLDENVVQEDVIRHIEKLNQDDRVDGILVQLPFPEHINEQQVLAHIDPQKDIDCITPYSIGKMLLGEDGAIAPATPSGVIHLLKKSGIELKGKDIVMVGRSNIVGKPLSVLLINESATVTVVHSKTKELSKKTQQADIVCVAVGKAGFLTADMIKEGAIVVDIGINVVNGKLCGDVHENVMGKASHLTPVPGGTGPMTITSLMDNTLRLIKNRSKL